MGRMMSSEKSPCNLGLGAYAFYKVCSGVTLASERISVAPGAPSLLIFPGQKESTLGRSIPINVNERCLAALGPSCRGKISLQPIPLAGRPWESGLRAG